MLMIFPSDWVKANVNVKVGDKIKFLDSGINNGDEKKPQFVFRVAIIRNGNEIDQKKMSINKTNVLMTSAAYGEDSAGWIGKIMDVTITKAKNPTTQRLVDSVLLIDPNEQSLPIIDADEEVNF